MRIVLILLAGVLLSACESDEQKLTKLQADRAAAAEKAATWKQRSDSAAVSTKFGGSMPDAIRIADSATLYQNRLLLSDRALRAFMNGR